MISLLAAHSIDIVNLFVYCTHEVFEEVKCETYDKLPDSQHSQDVKTVLTRVLTQTENKKPEDVRRLTGERTIKDFVASNVKVVDVSPTMYPIEVVMSDQKVAILLRKEQKTFAFPFTIAHETSHMLGNDLATSKRDKCLISIVSTLFFVYVLGWTLFPSLIAVITTMQVAHIALSHRYEMAADQFAITHCDANGLEAGRNFFTKALTATSQAPLFSRLMSLRSHPPVESRLARITAAQEKLKTD